MSGGGATLPGYENASTTEKSGWLYSPEARKLYLGTQKDPGPVRYALENAKKHAKMMQGVEDYDPSAWAKFTGMPEGSSGADISAALKRQLGYGSFEDMEKTRTAAHGGVMNLQGFAQGGTPKPKGLTEDQKTFVINMSKLAKLTPEQEARLAKIERETGTDVSPKESSGTRAPEDKRIIDAVSKINNTFTTAAETTRKSEELKGEAEKLGLTPFTAMRESTAFFDPNIFDPNKSEGLKATAGSTNPIYKEALDMVRKLQTPEEYAKAGDVYTRAADSLLAKGQYTPSEVKAYKADVTNAIAQGYVPQKINPSNVREVETAAYKPAASWTDKDVASKYMSPYMQNVIDLQKREANRDYAQQLQQLSKSASGQGAFGGSRHAILEAEAARNQQQLLNDIQAKGLQEAYTAGMGQFGSEQDRVQRGLEAYAQRALDAAKANMGRDLTIEERNQVAANAANEYAATAANTANMANAAAANVASGNYAAQQQAGELATQSAGLQANAQNVAALQGAGTAAAGLQGVGTAKRATEESKIGLLSGAGAEAQKQAQDYLTRSTEGARNVYGGTAAPAGQGISALSGSATGGTRNTTTTRNAKGGIIYAKR